VRACVRVSINLYIQRPQQFVSPLTHPVKVKHTVSLWLLCMSRFVSHSVAVSSVCGAHYTAEVCQWRRHFLSGHGYVSRKH